MYATIRRFEGVTDSRETGRLVKEGFVPLIRQIPGFVSYLWVDAGNGVVISTSVFKDKTGAEISNRRASEWVQQNLSHLYPNQQPQITAGEVIVFESL